MAKEKVVNKLKMIKFAMIDPMANDISEKQRNIIEDTFTAVFKELEKEPKKGHWKVVSDGYGDNSYICECSRCKDTVWVYKNADRKWNYCPNCGIQMEQELDYNRIRTPLTDLTPQELDYCERDLLVMREENI